MRPRQSETIVLNVPDNPRLHRAIGTVESLELWGAHVWVNAAATGRYRAGWEEMEAMSSGGSNGKASPTISKARVEGYTGDACDQCGGCRMKRNGACLLCEDCGSSSGCS